MSEQNILNPSATSLLNCDWGYSEGLPETDSNWQARSGKYYSRLQQARGRVYNLAWNGRDLATKHALQQWEAQYKRDFFTFVDWERTRYFSGRFVGPLNYSPSGNAKYNIQGQFMELPGLPLYDYPIDWTRDAAIFAVRDGFGNDLVKLTGAWGFFAGDGRNKFATPGVYAWNVTNDAVERVYFGYGYRIWHRKASDLGKIGLKTTRLRDGAVIADDWVDTYSAADVDSAPIYSPLGGFLPLDLYRVKLYVTGDKNAASSAYTVIADAIEVMQ